MDRPPPAPDAPPPARSVNRRWLAALEATGRLAGPGGRPLPLVIEALAAERGDAPALLSDTERFTFAELAARTRRYARWALSQELGPGDVVALMMTNRPEYLAAWLGITRTGAAVALLNTHLTGEALAHSLAVADARHAIVEAGFSARFEAPPPGLRPWSHGEGPFPRLDLALDALSDAPLGEAEAPVPALGERALLIYTSGTTGLPKAANVSHRRILSWCGWFGGLTGATPQDRLYDCLPLYHSVGGVAAAGAMLAAGGSVVVRERFSARAFWGDVVRWECTVFQYIGELCRYVLNGPDNPAAARHRLRLACGNGLRAEVWRPFQQRFAIPEILEFYASTEGNFSLYNVEGEPGAVGRIPPFLSHRFPAALVRFDAESGAPARGADGFCLPCAPDEVGEALGRISSADGGGTFEGYTSAAESERKVLRGVFAPGDAWFRTGDLLRRDARGFFYFVDRVGDTFRWKGENVATGEVAAVLARCPGVADANVYGVRVEGADGRAGMATVTTAEGFDLADVRRRVHAELPAYARPLFLRLRPEMAVTETFKHKKGALAEEGFDPARTADPLFFDDAAAGAYRPLDAALHARLAAGELRL